MWGHSWRKGDWEYYLKGFDHITLHEAIDFKDSIEIMQQAQIVINSSPRFKYGSHERVFYGSIAGALVLSNYSLFLPNQTFSYIPGNWNSIKNMEMSPKEIILLASEQQQDILKNHTWEQRSLELLKQIKKLQREK